MQRSILLFPFLFDFFVSPLTDKPAGSSKAKLFPFGWFFHVIPFSGCVFVKDTHSWEWYRWLQIYCLPIWPCAAWISYGSHNAGHDTEYLNHALARTQVSSLTSSDGFHPPYRNTNYWLKIRSFFLQTGDHYCTAWPFSLALFVTFVAFPTAMCLTETDFIWFKLCQLILSV